MARVRVVGLCAVAISMLALGSAGASVGALSVLVVKVTWGPQPVSAAEVDGALRDAESFYASASFGRVSIGYQQTPWLTVLSAPPVCNTVSATMALPSKLAPLAASAGYDPSRFDRVIYLFPESNCPYSGSYQVGGILLNGQINAPLVVHELGHSFGMGHAGAVACSVKGARRFCRNYVYGDPWDVMGAQVETNGGAVPAVGDFGALQKARVGWISNPTQISGPRVYELAALEQPESLPQALIVQTSGVQYWIDHREASGNDAYLATDPNTNPTSGFEVHRIEGAPDLTETPQYPLLPDYLLPQGRQNRYVTNVGQTFTLPNSFSLTALSRANGVMSIRFRWLDHTHPTQPRITGARATASGHVTVSWRASADTGTGVKNYVVALNSVPLTTVAARPFRNIYRTDLTAVPAGKQSLTLTAIDYAGNRSRAATRTVTTS